MLSVIAMFGPLGAAFVKDASSRHRKAQDENEVDMFCILQLEK
jgi:hypothetical protein